MHMLTTSTYVKRFVQFLDLRLVRKEVTKTTLFHFKRNYICCVITSFSVIVLGCQTADKCVRPGARVKGKDCVKFQCKQGKMVPTDIGL